MTGREADAFFIAGNSRASGRQGEAHWFCVPPGPEVPNLIAHERRNEDHTVRRIYGRATKLLHD
jgi:hypothetical protein